MKNFLSIECSNRGEIESLVESAAGLKAARDSGDLTLRPLEGQCWGMMFSKSSTRTRVSFEVGIGELGGTAMFLSSRDLQLGRGEPIRDTARVLGRMIHGAVIRNDSQADIEEFAEFSSIPTINALTEMEHPCQIVADLLTIHERIGGWAKKKIVFVGDGDCNVARSWIWAAKHLGFELVIVGPRGFCPTDDYLAAVDAPNVSCVNDPLEASVGAHVLYTDVWVSMGMEEEAARREEAFNGYQVNAELLAVADSNAIVMHCLPAYRGKEISGEVLEDHAETIFSEAENRLHAQKAILLSLTTG
ncbi:MAG: ornithine carbamoyltransferase [Verrucomicrobiaceae bacterium]|nr:ornithine carbamoyltransferase [Verrucomicrobiaceae bacterium]